MSMVNRGPGSTERLDNRNLEAPLSPADTALAHLRGRALEANRGVPLNLDWVEAVRINTSAVERRAQTLVARRTVKKDWQAAWLLPTACGAKTISILIFTIPVSVSPS